MKQGKHFNVFILAAISLLLMASCASTKLYSVLRDESYSGKIKKVFIIGAFPKPDIRRKFEHEFVNQLKSRGVDAVASNQLIPSDKMLDKETIVSKIKGLDIDAVLVTRLVEKKTIVTDYGGWYYNYSGGYERAFKDELVSLETNLYEVWTEKLIWSVLSETYLMEERSSYTSMKSLVKGIVEKLSEEKFIKAGK